MISNLLMGSAFKIGANIVNTWMANKADEHRANVIRDEASLRAHVALAKATNNDWLGKLSRSIIFLMLTGTFCYMGIYILHNYVDFQEGLVPKKPGFFGRVFGHTEYTVVKSGWNIIFYQFYEIMEMVIGFFCVPSRKR